MLASNILGVGKADRTRGLLRERAIDLFLRNGFDATTVAEIAAAAGVTRMTFFRHFPSKESVVLDDPYDPLIVELILAQDAALPAVERVRLGLLAAWQSAPEPTDHQTIDRIRLVSTNPGLRAAMWESNHRTEDLIVAGLVCTGVERVAARVAAGACLGALTAALLDWASSSEPGGVGEQIRMALTLMGPPALTGAAAG
jgi:AcrR family transcriptional regulator